MRVKICGIKRLEDALLAEQAGADAIGLLVGQRHTSPDFISVETARDIVTQLPPFISPVLVTHSTSLAELKELVIATNVSTIQIHSELGPAGILSLRGSLPYLKVLKSYHVIGPESLNYGEPFRKCVDAFVLDTVRPETGQVGGTGLTHDWRISRSIVEHYQDIPCILAGGLKPENVADAIAQVRPFGVDVNSGTKGSDGFKDPAKLADFVRRANSTLLRLPANAIPLLERPQV